MKQVAAKINWKYVIIGALILGLILYIYFTGKAAGKRGKVNVIPLPNDLAPNTPQVNAGDVRRISTALYDEMNGFNWGGHDYTPYNEFSRLSDMGFVAVYNDFNKQYQGLGKGTLKQWLIDEIFTVGDVVDDVILPRMAKLGLA